MNEVKFKVGLKAEWEALESKDPMTIYFLLDTQEMYKGNLLMGTGRIENLNQEETIEIYGGSATDNI